MRQQEASITLHMFRAAFVFCFFNGIAAVTEASRFVGGQFFRYSISSEAVQKSNCLNWGLGNYSFVSGQSLGYATAPQRGVYVASTPLCCFFFGFFWSKDPSREPNKTYSILLVWLWVTFEGIG